MESASCDLLWFSEDASRGLGTEVHIENEKSTSTRRGAAWLGGSGLDVLEVETRRLLVHWGVWILG
eukprot:3940976-Rhodomonas_salina.1